MNRGFDKALQKHAFTPLSGLMQESLIKPFTLSHQIWNHSSTLSAYFLFQQVMHGIFFIRCLIWWQLVKQKLIKVQREWINHAVFHQIFQIVLPGIHHGIPIFSRGNIQTFRSNKFLEMLAGGCILLNSIGYFTTQELRRRMLTWQRQIWQRLIEAYKIMSIHRWN